MKLDKYQFCTAVDNYRSMLEEESDIAKALGIGAEWKPLDWIQTYYDFLTEMSELDEDPIYGTDLDWFCFETNFGQRDDMNEIYDKYTKRTWKIDSPEVLYDFIMRNE